MTSRRDLKNYAKQAMSGKYGILILAFVAVQALALISSMISSALFPGEETIDIVLSYAFTFILTLLINVVAAGMFVYAGICGGRNDLAIVGWAGGVILFAGLFDMMDGRVARLGNMSSKFGALYDSVLDRYSELMTFFGICYYLSMKDYFFYALIAFVALIGSLMVSYVRARAEGLGIECKVGFMQRPERVVLTSLGALFCGVFKDITAFDPMLILIVPLAFVAVFANITAFARVRHCYKVMMK